MNLRPSFDPNPNPNQSNYYWFDTVFSEKELFEINKLQAKYQFNNGTTVGETEGDIRKSKIKGNNKKNTIKIMEMSLKKIFLK